MEHGTVGEPGHRVETSDPAVRGTVTGLISTTRYALRRRSTSLGVGLLGAGSVALALTFGSRLAMPLWVLPGALLGAAGGLLWLSTDAAEPVAGTGAARLWWSLRTGLYLVVRPAPVPADGATTTGQQTRAQRFDVVDVHGSRVTCEYLGAGHRRTPERGAMVEVYGRRRSDGAVQVRRITTLVDGATFSPWADPRFALTRLATGAAGISGLALLAFSLVVMILRAL